MKLHTRHILIAVGVGVFLLIIASLALGGIWPRYLGKLFGGVSGLVVPIHSPGESGGSRTAS